VSARRAAADSGGTSVSKLSFIDFLEQRLKTTPPRQKGLRTRERLRIATARVLDSKGYHALRVTDITGEAGVAEGSFYVYFKDKTEASLDVLTELLEEFLIQEVGLSPTAESPFASIRHANRHWLAFCRANQGLMRGVLQVGDELPRFAKLVQQSNHHWYSHVAASVVKHHPAGSVSPEGALLAAYLLGTMMDEIARKLIVYQDRKFVMLLASLRADDDALADAASVLWMRALYPGWSMEGELPHAAEILRNWPVPGGKRPEQK
jgi:TetR/AcrR family transcriptional regulator, transcriptional repressor for nem operon